MADWLSPGDPNSYSRPEECSVTFMDLELSVNFDRHVISGMTKYSCKRNKVGCDILVRKQHKTKKVHYCTLHYKLQLLCVVILCALCHWVLF